jgi:selenide,water dikinase
VPVISREVDDLIKRGCVPGGTRQNLYSANVIVDWRNTPESKRILLADAQTSGGLLLCVAESKLERVLQLLRKARTPSAAVVGRLVSSRRGPLVCMTK